MEIKAVFIDLDGTLIDSVPLLYEVYCQFLQIYDYRGSAEEFQRLNGPSLSEIISFLKEKYKLPQEETILVDQYQSLLKMQYANHAKLFPGVKVFLEQAKALGLKVLLVTSCARGLAQQIIKSHGLDTYFDAIVSAEDTKHSKPAPDIYLKALLMANVKASEVIAIEDSSNGVKAALAAKIPTIQFNPQRSQTVSKEVMIACSWEEISRLIKNWKRRN